MKKALLFTAVLSIGCLAYFLPYFQNQAQVSFFAYTPDFVKAFFEGCGPNPAQGEQVLSQGYLPACGVQSDATFWNDEPVNRIAPRIGEFFWRFIAQFYLNLPLLLLTVSLVTLLFCLSARMAAGVYAPCLLPLFFLFFGASEPSQAAVSITLLLDVAALALFKALFARFKGFLTGCSIFFLSFLLFLTGGFWALFFGLGVSAAVLQAWRQKTLRVATAVAFLLCWLVPAVLLWGFAYTPAFHYPPLVWIAVLLFAFGLTVAPLSHHSGPQYVSWGVVLVFCLTVFFTRNHDERLLMRTRQAAVENNYAGCLRLCEKYYNGKQPLSVNASQKEARLRYEMAAWLKLSLLKTGQANTRFFEYTALPEMNLLYPREFPFRYACGYAYVKLYQTMEINAPLVPLLFAIREKAGWQNRYVEPLLDALIQTRQMRLAQQLLELFQKTSAHRKLTRRYTGLLQETPPDGARPVALNNPALIESADNPDDWVRVYFEQRAFGGKLDTLEGYWGPYVVCYKEDGFAPSYTSLQLTDQWRETLPDLKNLPPELLEYYMLTRFVDKRLDIVLFLTEIYRKSGRETLPQYVQEALCYHAGYPGRISREKFLESDFSGYRIQPHIVNLVEDIYRDGYRLRAGKLSFDALTRQYGSTLTYHLLYGKVL